MRKEIVAIFIILNFLNFSELSYCDIIHLNNGRKIEGKVIEKTEDIVRIAVSGGKVAFKMSAVKEIEETINDVSDNNIGEKRSTIQAAPSDLTIVNKMASEDIKRYISGIKVINITCAKTSPQGNYEYFQANVTYKSRYNNNEVNNIPLLYKYNTINKQWIRPKKAAILELAAPPKESSDFNSKKNSNQARQGGEWKKEYKIKGTVRKRRLLIGPDQPRED